MTRPQTIQQALVLTGMALACISDGYIFGQMSGMINALRADDSSIPVSEDEIALIASIVNIACIGGFVILIVLLEVFGRKMCVTVITVPIIISWLMLYFADDKGTILASRVIGGIAYGGILPLIYIIIGEYVAPHRRPFFLSIIVSGMTYTGIMLGHILSIFFDWRKVALIGVIPTVMSAILPFFWVESPYWFANRGQYQECEKAYKALHLSNPITDKELKDLIEKCKISDGKCSNKNPLLKAAKIFLKMLKKKYYYNIIFLLFVLNIYRVATGRILLGTMAISIIEDITGSKDIFIFTLLFDGFQLIGVMVCCFFINKLNIRPLLFISGTIANFIQISLSILLYCYPNSDNILMTWVKIILLVLYYTTVTAGPYCVVDTLLSELYPLQVKGVSIFIVATFTGVIQFLDIKIASKMFYIIGYHGVFLFHSVVVFLSLIYVYFYLPETKGMSLEEIECYFKNNQFDVKEDSNKIKQKENLLNQDI